MKKKIVILYSGGLDSFILYHWGKKKYPEYDIKCIYYKHGCSSQESELKNLPDFVDIRNIDWLTDTNKAVSKSTDIFAGNIYIPGRNLVFLTLSACQELPDEIWMGTLSDEDNEGATDKNTKFRQETERLLNYTLSPFLKNDIQIRFPFVELGFNKIASISWLRENTSVSDLEITQQISCWFHDGQNCGNCKQCFKRELSFKILGITDSYKENPLTNLHGQRLIKMYIEKYESGNYNSDELNVYKMIKKLGLN